MLTSRSYAHLHHTFRHICTIFLSSSSLLSEFLFEYLVVFFSDHDETTNQCQGTVVNRIFEARCVSHNVWGSLCSCIQDIWYSSGRDIAPAVSRWLPTAASWVRARVWSCGICGGQSGAGAGFLRILRFPLPIFIPPIAPQSPSFIILG
jgi:hypothetical protein